MAKILSDAAITNLIPSNRKKINSALVLSGGGTNQTYFSCGAVGCLIDNGLFDFDLISGISGGTLLLTLIDLCTSPLFNYWKQPDWFNRYVRTNVYKATDSQMVATFFKNGLDPNKLQIYLFQQLSDFDKRFDKENTNIMCEYNYVDANRREITSNHLDIIDLKNKVEYPYWYLIRPLRCTMPATVFNGKPTYDAGSVANIPVNSIFTRYDPKKVIFIQAVTNLKYETYPESKLIDLALNAFSITIDSANNSLQDMIDLATNDCDSVIYCSMSNELLPSKDKYHAGLFSNWIQEVPTSMRFYNGFLYNDTTLMKIIENEGYIQMYYQLKKVYPKRKLVFRIPNPEVYNTNVKELLKESLAKNVGFEFVKEFIKAPFLP